MHDIIAIIPVRGGSKGIPRKNMQKVRGRTLTEWTVQCALDSGVAADVVVTTDDEEMQQEAIRVGAKAPFLRPAHLASDTADSYDAVKHAVEWMEKERGKRYSHVLLLQATTPFRSAEDVKEAVRMLTEQNGECLVSFCKVEDPHPEKVHSIEDGKAYTYIGKKRGVCRTRRQDLPPAYRLNGAVYLTRRDVFDERLISEDVTAYVMPEERSVNIDAPIDLEIARRIVKEGNI